MLSRIATSFKLCTGFGAAYGTAKSGVGIASMGVMRPELVMKSIVPVVMAGVLGIYGLIIAVIISTGSKTVSSCLQLLRGLSVVVLRSLHAAGPGFLAVLTVLLCCSQPDRCQPILPV